MNGVEVVRVVAAHPPSQGDFVVINAADFDPSVHVHYVDASAQAHEPEQPVRRAETTRARKSTGAQHGDR